MGIRTQSDQSHPDGSVSPEPAGNRLKLAVGGRDTGQTESSTSRERAREEDWEDEETRPSTTDGRPRRATATTGPVAVRIAGGGQVIQAASEELADAVAYAARLGGLIGELLGLEELRAVEYASRAERLVMFTDEEGDLVALRLPATADMTVLRDRLGL